METVLQEAKAPAKVPVFFKLEYPVHSSPKILYDFISTSFGLSQWFAERVDDKGKLFTFYWEGTARKAEITGKKLNEFIRFRWLDDTADTHFEFRVAIDEVTNDVSLLISDYGYSKKETDEMKRLWDNQIASLKHLLGAS